MPPTRSLKACSVRLKQNSRGIQITKFRKKGTSAMKKTVFCLCLCLSLLCGCAPRAKEYPATTAAGVTPLSTLKSTDAGQAVSVPMVRTEDPPAQIAVPEGWTAKSDAGMHQLTRPGLDAAIEFTAAARIHPDYTYKKELSALEASVKRSFSEPDITFKNNYYVQGEYSGIEMLYTFIPADAQKGEQTAHAVIFFKDGYEYDLALTCGTPAFIEAEQAFKDVLFSLVLG